MGATSKLEILIKANDKASAKMKGVGKSANAMGANLAKVGGIMTGVGIGMIATLGKFANSFSKAGDEVQKMAKRTGFSTEALSELRHVAKITGTELGSIEKATKRMSKSIIDADRGLETYKRSFDELGLEISTLRAMKPEEQFWTIANAISALEDQTLKASLAQEIFGRAGPELLPMFAETAEGIDALRQEAHDLNLVFDQEAADSAAAFEDAKTKLVGALQGIGFAIAEDLMPLLTDLVTKLTDGLKPVLAWLDEHPNFSKGLLIAAAAILGTGGLLIGIRLLTAAFGPLIASLVSVWALLPGGFVRLAVAMGAIAGIMAGLGKAFGIGPMAGLFPKKKIMKYEPGMGPPPPGYTYGEVDEKPSGLAPGQTYGYGIGGEIPSFATGGIVPGPIGQPRLVEAHGGEYIGHMAGNVYITVQGSVVTERDLAETLRRAFIKVKARNTTTGL